MNMRICPEENILSEYLAGGPGEEERDLIEKHLADCSVCRKLIADTHSAMKLDSFNAVKGNLIKNYKENIWLVLSIIFLLISFFVHRFFLQFIVLALLTGSKWIIDKRTMKMMIIEKEVEKQKERAL